MDLLRMMGETQLRLKYGRYRPELSRRETGAEIFDRFHAFQGGQPFYNSQRFERYMPFVRDAKVMPSMRMLQFAGQAIHQENARAYNCSFLHIDSFDSFEEVMYLLLCGTGVGYSVQREIVDMLPARAPRWLENSLLPIVVPDDKDGWARSINHLVTQTMQGQEVTFDYSKIRPKGSPLITSGGKAPGPEPLIRAHERIRTLLREVKVGEKLTPLQCHLICCMSASAVLAGGIRRSAMICLFSPDDEEMLRCKTGHLWDTYPELAYANNSAIATRDMSLDQFMYIIGLAEAYGEPGIYWADNPYWGANPCVEIGLQSRQFCNLTEIRVSDVGTQAELLRRVEVAAALGTYQAALTNFGGPLKDKPQWKVNAENEALLGVSMTGIASQTFVSALKRGDINLRAAANYAKAVNAAVAAEIGINPAARVTCIKPAGTTSIVMGCSSGIHAWHAPYYIRRVTTRKDDPLYAYMNRVNPHMIEDSVYNDQEAFLKFPIKAPAGSLMRKDESALKLLNRALKFNEEWVKPGHRTGDNSHNVSCTISVKDGEWEDLALQMYEHRHRYHGLSLLSYDPKSYPQTPFEEIEKATFEEMASKALPINLEELQESEDNTNLQGELACAGGACEI